LTELMTAAAAAFDDDADDDDDDDDVTVYETTRYSQSTLFFNGRSRCTG